MCIRDSQKLFERAKKSGYVRVIVDGSMYELSEDIPMEKNINKKTIILAPCFYHSFCYCYVSRPVSYTHLDVYKRQEIRL